MAATQAPAPIDLARERARRQLLRVQDADGSTLIVAPSRSRPGTGYVLRPGPDGRWTCTCDGFGWRGRCSHTDAAGAGPLFHSR